MASPLPISTSVRCLGFLTQKDSLLNQSFSALKSIFAFLTETHGFVLLARLSVRTS